MSSIRFALCAAVAVASAGSLVSAQLYGVGQLPGTAQRTRMLGLSGDGRTAVGYGETSTGTYPIWWTLGGGLHAANVDGQYMGTSANGAVFVGNQNQLPLGPMVGSPSGSHTMIGALPGLSRGGAAAVSANGEVVVGNSQGASASFTRAFRWTQSGGFQDLGFFGDGNPNNSRMFATGVSGDGQTVVGASRSNLSAIPWRWTPAGGLQALPRPNGFDADAVNISSDATIAIGYSRDGSNFWHQTIWTLQGTPTATQLPRLANNVSGETFANDVSDAGDGQFGHGVRAIVGTSAVNGSGDPVATYWTAAGGMMILSNVLNAHGVSTAGWELFNATSISDDGYTVAGYGRHNGLLEGFVAVIPTPSVAGFGPILLCAAAIRRRRC